MKLLQVRMQDFRQFLGEAIVDFAHEDERKVTVVHGENGVGKTTILNAIHWCFYGITLSDFERPDRLVNDMALAEDRVTIAKVEVQFVHDDTVYRIERTFDQKTNKSEVKGFTVINGNNVPVDNIGTVITRIIPSTMSPYFFFHGEGLNSLGSTDSFRDAVRSILGFNHADHAIDLLRKLRVKWQKEATKLQKLDDQARAALQGEIRASEKIAEEENSLAQASKNLRVVESELSKIDTEIASIRVQDVEDLIHRRGRLEGKLRVIPDQLDSIANQQIGLIKKFGWSLYGHSSLMDSAKVLQSFRTKRKLPSEYNDRFIHSILEAGKCICGAELPATSKARENVEAMLVGAATSDEEDALASAIGIAENINDVSNEFTTQVTKLLGARQKLLTTQGSVQRELEDIRNRIAQVDHTRLQQLEADREDLKKLAKRLRDAKHICEINLKNARGTLAEAKRKKKKAVDEELLGVYKHRLDFIDRVVARLRDVIDAEESSAQTEMQENINGHLEKYSRKDYFAEISEDFSFELKKKDGSAVAKSKGERALLNISFISALIQLAKNRRKLSNEYFVQGTAAPFVIDAPFGELDNEYRGAVARFLPESTEQLVVLLSSSHWGSVVENGLRERTGREYILVSESTIDPSAGRTRDTIRINGEYYECSRYGQERDRTSIQEV